MWFFYDYNFLSPPLHQGLLEAESQIEPELKELLSKAGADEYAPIFAKKGVKMKQLTYMNDKQLSEVLLIEKHMFCIHTRWPSYFDYYFLWSSAWYSQRIHTPKNTCYSRK